MLDPKTISTLKRISIRGRVAYGACCLENAMLHFKIKNDVLDEVIWRIWTFTSSNNLDEWDELTNEVNPICILDENIPSDPLFLLYTALPFDLVDMVSEVIEIGVGNLYAGTGEYSPSTLEHLINVIEKCMILKIELPVFAHFERSSFSEEHGWGLERDKSFFAEN